MAEEGDQRRRLLGSFARRFFDAGDAALQGYVIGCAWHQHYMLFFPLLTHRWCSTIRARAPEGVY